MKYDYIFVVLCYRNTTDIISFLISASSLDDIYKVILVNSYYDEVSKSEFENIARRNNCDFLNVPNRGYGAGNNRGIEYAAANYEFDFLVICNPDIELKSFPKKLICGMQNCIIAPEIKKLNGKHQNPHYSVRMPFVEWIEYMGFKKNYKLCIYIGIGITKIRNRIKLVKRESCKSQIDRIYAAHGSCVLIGKEVLDKCGEIYDENMFLFAEENHLAQLAKKNGIYTYMIPGLKVVHKEDGSVNYINKEVPQHLKKSYIYYYEKWIKKKI